MTTELLTPSGNQNVQFSWNEPVWMANNDWECALLTSVISANQCVNLPMFDHICSSVVNNDCVIKPLKSLPRCIDWCRFTSAWCVWLNILIEMTYQLSDILVQPLSDTRQLPMEAGHCPWDWYTDRFFLTPWGRGTKCHIVDYVYVINHVVFAPAPLEGGGSEKKTELNVCFFWQRL